MAVLKYVFIVTMLLSGVLVLPAQVPKGFSIHLQIGGLAAGDKMMLMHSDPTGDHTDDSCIVVENGEGQLQGIAPLAGPYAYQIYFKGRPHKGQMLDLLIANGEEVRIGGCDIDKVQRGDFQDEATITGSPTQKAMDRLKALGNLAGDLSDDLGKIADQAQERIGYERDVMERILSARQAIFNELKFQLLTRPMAANQPAIPAMVCSIEDASQAHMDFEMALYRSLDDTIKNSFFGRRLWERAVLSVGQRLPSFVLPDTSGKAIALDGIVAKSKVTLVYFWASNSNIKDRYDRDLAIEYKMYHGRGLNIIGVSADPAAENWKIALRRSGYPWANVSDLKGNLKGGIVNDVYREGGHHIPNSTNVLLDAQGRIIAWDPMGAVLKYYLEKYLGN